MNTNQKQQYPYVVLKSSNTLFLFQHQSWNAQIKKKYFLINMNQTFWSEKNSKNVVYLILPFSREIDHLHFSILWISLQ